MYKFTIHFWSLTEWKADLGMAGALVYVVFPSDIVKDALSHFVVMAESAGVRAGIPPWT